MQGTAIIIGAGPAGLTAALELERQSGIKPILIEASNDIGGISRTVRYKGNRMDIGGHRFFRSRTASCNGGSTCFPLKLAQKRIANSVTRADSAMFRHRLLSKVLNRKTKSCWSASAKAESTSCAASSTIPSA
jgi:monoamine oxidase